VLAGVFGNGLSAGLMAHVIAAITDKGFTPTQAAGVLSVGTFVGLVGALIAGVAMDHFRSARVLSFFGLTLAIGCAVFGFADAAFGGLTLLIVGMALQRAALSAMMPGGTYALTRFVGMRSFGEAYSMLIFVLGLASGIAPPLFGVLYDRTGSYAPMYFILIGGALAGAAIYPLLGNYRYAVRPTGQVKPAGDSGLSASAA
jgi:MFS family permease